jgi:hypothetical protein
MTALTMFMLPNRTLPEGVLFANASTATPMVSMRRGCAMLLAALADSGLLGKPTVLTRVAALQAACSACVNAWSTVSSLQALRLPPIKVQLGALTHLLHGRGHCLQIGCYETTSLSSIQQLYSYQMLYYKCKLRMLRALHAPLGQFSSCNS